MVRVGCGNCFIGWFALAGLCASGQALNDSPTIPDGDNWFDHPDILCTALQTLGYHARSWGQIGGSPVYNCMYPPVVRPSDTPAAIDAMLATAQPPAPLTLGFEVSGLNPMQADSVRIAVTVPTREATAKAKDQMLKCIDSLYRVIGQRVPSALTAYVQREQRYLSHQRYGTVFFVVTSDHDAQVFWFYLRKSP
jgi:hypothetical protein